MKKTLLLSALLISAMSGAAFAEKVTYEQALNDSNAYLDSLPQHDKATEGLGPDEANPSTRKNQMGTWQKQGGSTSSANAGDYSSLLAPDALGKSCVKGDKGLIVNSESECQRWNSGGWMCQEWSAPEIDMSKGQKAECK
ncbi:hypothetical protein GNP84_06615 [Aliivibrio fischeri]|uniref:hypothetical protein n=1 Tax=Aliivibrio fischeri TaxID=668 RepID=UPI0012D9749F|nr:hypothetical protein [Aliivibrio fischeri]MUK76578.1 hypothetical protein [Aliivibrio fischeri]